MWVYEQTIAWTPGLMYNKGVRDKDTMNDATKEILSTYDMDTLKEIADHGCGSGVCSQHIYYGDTIKFFDKYADEVTEYLADNYGTEFLTDLFAENLGRLDFYKNDVTWAFIESVAFEVTEDALEAV